MTQYGFYFDSSRCTGCKTCEMACKDYKDLSQTVAFRKVYDDEGGTWTAADDGSYTTDAYAAALETLIAENGWECKSHVVVPDERPFIASAIVRACDEQDVDVVLTCGGSGLSLRDVTPEATMDACDRNVPGIAEAMRAHSLAITPYAMLSRALCMQRGRHLVINLPGSEKAARENWDGVVKALPHAVKMMAGGGH